jgi:hypothetical protein
MTANAVKAGQKTTHAVQVRIGFIARSFLLDGHSFWLKGAYTSSS